MSGITPAEDREQRLVAGYQMECLAPEHVLAVQSEWLFLTV